MGTANKQLYNLGELRKEFFNKYVVYFPTSEVLRKILKRKAKHPHKKKLG